MGALPETASNAAFALAAALSIGDLPLVTLALVVFFSFLFLVGAFAAFFAAVFLAMLFVAFALEEVFWIVAFFVDEGFLAAAGVLRLFVVFFAIGAFFAVSLVGDMGGIIIGLGWLDKG